MEMSPRLRALTPASVRQPFAAYSHGTHVPAGAEWVFTSGQLGISPDDAIPPEPEAQADICFASIDAILAEAGFARRYRSHQRLVVTDRAHMAATWRRGIACVRTWPPPASTSVIVSASPGRVQGRRSKVTGRRLTARGDPFFEG